MSQGSVYPERTHPIQTVDVVVPCHEAGTDARKLRDALLTQLIPRATRLHIIFVDDGSTTEGAVPADVATGSARIMRHSTNRGRAAACNTGANSSSGDVIWFLDSDCRPESPSTLEAHLDAMRAHDGSVGPVRASGSSFWSRYQNRNASHRVRRVSRHFDVNACTSANFMLRRESFTKANGFDEDFRTYGFEDRDFFLRLLGQGASLTYTQNAIALHDAKLDLTNICRKMMVAGRYSSDIFRRAHPVAYKETTYGRLDARSRGFFFSLLAKGLWRGLQALTPLARRVLELSVLPFIVRAWIARLYSACAFAYGTVLGKHQMALPPSIDPQQPRFGDEMRSH